MILLPSSVSFYDSRFSTSIATNTTLNAMSIVERIHQNTKEISIPWKKMQQKKDIFLPNSYLV